jgi:NAD-dependent DNA ligase
MWPANILLSRISLILKDVMVDDDEKKDLLKILSDISGGVEPLPDRYQDKSLTLAFDDPLPDISFPKKIFCLTGQFCYGPRSRCEEEIIRRGGVVKKNVIFSLDYLVVGTFGNAEWIHTSYGRKIEEAMEIKNSNKSNLAIVPEEHWASKLQNSL